MQRVTRSTAAAVLPSPPASPGAPGYFSGGDPVAGVPATVPGHEWFNGVQEEIIAVLSHAGLSPSAADLAQMQKSVSRMAAAAVAALTVNTTLTADHAGIVGIAITANRTFTLPLANAAGGRPIRFTFVRTDTSAFTATVARAGSDTIEGATSITVPVGGRVTLVSDGVSAWRVVANVSGRLINVQIFTSSGTYTPTPGAQRATVELVGGGGAGGGSAATGGGFAGGGGGGGSGGYGLLQIASGLASQTVTIGAGGAGVSAGNGGAGGTSSFGSLMSCTGGAGGAAAGAFNTGSVSASAGGGGTVTGGTGMPGAFGYAGLTLSAGSAIGGNGGQSRWGAGGQPNGANGTAVVNGLAGQGYGAGGGGAVAVSSGAPGAGGAGTAGLCIVWEYS